jgi:hypothetical protein
MRHEKTKRQSLRQTPVHIGHPNSPGSQDFREAFIDDERLAGDAVGDVDEVRRR